MTRRNLWMDDPMSLIARTFCAAFLFALPLVACNDGPAENAGERLDRAAQNVRDAVDPPSGPVERAGRAIDRAVD